LPSLQPQPPPRAMVVSRAILDLRVWRPPYAPP
jgi:hypothetical protein